KTMGIETTFLMHQRFEERGI
ncbi:hypothetical protein A5852_000037, partial [Enterococcus faecium]